MDLRRQALDRLRESHQQLNPFKFIFYSEWAGAELLPVSRREIDAQSDLIPTRRLLNVPGGGESLAQVGTGKEL